MSPQKIHPSLSINSALLNRCKVVVLSKLTTDECTANDDNQANEEVSRYLAVMSDGDARVALDAIGYYH
ncbi:1767_t:CDS:2 [Funneliformis mosseae]|uniref:1767_t:CDS:1 n=1 Tax=Funneliformis mosseae TaxID=27381 RepID=A0A9N9G1K2_FUNMO|nr:1767_t:CDS:2 [Funneliformis mosseae]